MLGVQEQMKLERVAHNKTSIADRKADLFLSGPGIVGLAFTPSRAMIVATTNALYRVDVGIKGRPLV